MRQIYRYDCNARATTVNEIYTGNWCDISKRIDMTRRVKLTVI